jgi:hypothetical protein
MRPLLKILLGGLIVFLTISIAQEWSFFSSAWFGQPQAPPALTDEENKEVADTVHLTLSLMRHLYLSGGDPRFAERMPASEGMIEEILADVRYLARNRRVQDNELVRLDVLTVEPAGPDRVTVETRERWQVRIQLAHGEGGDEPVRTQLVHGRYFVVRESTGWRVEGWEVVDPGESTPRVGA